MMVDFNSNITVDGSDLPLPEMVAKYETGVMDVLKQIANPPESVGAAFLKTFPSNAKVVIIPYQIKASSKEDGTCNSHADKASFLESGDARIRFSIDKLQGCSGPGTEKDELLLHEIVHAKRLATGKFKKVAFLQADQGYENSEEFLAIVIANMYRSYKGRTDLRKDHMGYTGIPSKWSTSAGFLAEPTARGWIEKFMSDELGFARQMQSRSDIPFNPFEELKWQQRLATPSPSSPSSLNGNWFVGAGDWRGIFAFGRDNIAQWMNLGNSTIHNGQWSETPTEFQWKYDDDPEGWQRTFIITKPLQSKMHGRVVIGTAPHGEFDMVKET